MLVRSSYETYIVERRQTRDPSGNAPNAPAAHGRQSERSDDAAGAEEKESRPEEETERVV